MEGVLRYDPKGEPLNLIMGWTVITAVVVYLPLVRCLMDGDSYRWGMSWFGYNFRSSGISGDLWVLVLQAVVVLALLDLGWGGGSRVFPWVLVGWHGLLTGNAVHGAIRDPDGLRFRGDTLGIDVSLTWVAPLLLGAFLLLALYWMLRKTRAADGARRIWTRRNTVLLSLALCVLPVQFVLLRFGEPHATTDEIGVLLTMAQWVLIAAALYPWKTARLSD
jgi:hypothetical protein